MNLIVAFAAPPSDRVRSVMATLALPTLDRLAARWQASRRDEADASTLSMPHERAWSAALGWSAPDGCLPWAARHAALDGIHIGPRPWGLLTPVHWRIGSDGVHLADPALLELSAAESKAFFNLLKPLFESEGYVLAWGAPLRWYVAHDSLQGLACASLDRVIGRNVDAWVPRQLEAKPLRRLQNEAQMVLHVHALNEAREARGALAVNSFWLSGCGRAQAEHANDVKLDESLRAAALKDDEAAWSEAWRALDAASIAPLMAQAASGAPVRLTLCGDSGSVELEPRPRSLRQRIADTFSSRQDTARSLLESL